LLWWKGEKKITGQVGGGGKVGKIAAAFGAGPSHCP
jgi:hypothetical protein